MVHSALHEGNHIRPFTPYIATRAETVALPTNEKVNNMKQANWKLNTNKVRVWAENQPPSDNLQAVMLSLTLGDSANTDELRSTYWTAIRSIGSTMDGFPSARRGRESTLTEEQEIVLATVEQKVIDAFAQIPTEYHDLLLSVIVPHGRTGGVYADYDDLVAYYKKSAHNYMMQSIKDGRFDGVAVDENGIPEITPRPTKADMEVSEEE
tara:strand:- start:1589 stop:2215 length:627 start_codon:yes stop_codon:yes gene_type:complete